MDKKHWPEVLLAVCLACTVVLALRSWWLGTASDGGGVGFLQFLWLLLATPSLTTLAGVAYALRRHAQARAPVTATQERGAESPAARAGAGTAFRAMMTGFLLLLCWNWLQLWLLWPAPAAGS
jgi:hypothetical protein